MEEPGRLTLAGARPACSFRIGFSGFLVCSCGRSTELGLMIGVVRVAY